MPYRFSGKTTEKLEHSALSSTLASLLSVPSIVQALDSTEPEILHPKLKSALGAFRNNALDHCSSLFPSEFKTQSVLCEQFLDFLCNQFSEAQLPLSFGEPLVRLSELQENFDTYGDSLDLAKFLRQTHLKETVFVQVSWDEEPKLETIVKLLKKVPDSFFHKGNYTLKSFVGRVGYLHYTFSKQKEKWECEGRDLTWIEVCWECLTKGLAPVVLCYNNEPYSTSPHFVSSMEYQKLLSLAQLQDEFVKLKLPRVEKPQQFHRKDTFGETNSTPVKKLDTQVIKELKTDDSSESRNSRNYEVDFRRTHEPFTSWRTSEPYKPENYRLHERQSSRERPSSYLQTEPSPYQSYKPQEAIQKPSTPQNHEFRPGLHPEKPRESSRPSPYFQEFEKPSARQEPFQRVSTPSYQSRPYPRDFSYQPRTFQEPNYERPQELTKSRERLHTPNAFQESSYERQELTKSREGLYIPNETSYERPQELRNSRERLHIPNTPQEGTYKPSYKVFSRESSQPRKEPRQFSFDNFEENRKTLPRNNSYNEIGHGRSTPKEPKNPESFEKESMPRYIFNKGLESPREVPKQDFPDPQNRTYSFNTRPPPRDPYNSKYEFSNKETNIKIPADSWTCPKCAHQEQPDKYECSACRQINWDKFYEIKSRQRSSKPSYNMTPKSRNPGIHPEYSPRSRPHTPNLPPRPDSRSCPNCSSLNSAYAMTCYACNKMLPQKI
mmetsp:Transcript_1090/g.1731  ORF Transcript_1090/g.1731 Transcript_1090/m.1731 type:complete len:721 (+) Transcript_1090:3-2165(+)